MKSDTRVAQIGFSRFRFAALVLVLLSVCSCAQVALPKLTNDEKSEQLVNQALIDDEALANFQNKMTLLNIVRAYKQAPRQYVDVSSWNQGVPTISAGATKAFGMYPSSVGSSANLSAQSDTSLVTVSPLTKQNFVRGITTPVSAKTVAYFVEQGYPPSMLLHLFVRDISVYSADGQLKHIYVNSPSAEAAPTEFDAIANGLAACLITADVGDIVIDEDDAEGPSMSVSEVRSLRWQTNAAEKGYSLVHDPDSPKVPDPGARYFLAKLEPHLIFRLGYKDGLNKLCKAAYAAMGLGPVQDSNTENDPAPKNPHMEIGLRSPEAVIYYIGEMARVQFKQAIAAKGKNSEAAYTPFGTVDLKKCFKGPDHADCSPGCISLFLLTSDDVKSYTPTFKCALPPIAKDGTPTYAQSSETSAGFPGPMLTVDYDGTTYGISMDNQDLSDTVMVFTIAEQIVGQQTDASELPTTNIVKAVP